MMYESPILTTQIGEHISTELSEQEEAFVFSVVKRIYVDVDRDELIKALAYDRGQYEKGYSDGRKERDAEIVRCKDCKHYQFADNRAFGMPVKMCEWFGFEDVDDGDFCSRAERRDNV